MIIIGFSRKTSKILPKLLCKNFRHVAIIVPNADTMTMMQFVKYNQIIPIKISLRDIKILEKFGWEFLMLPRKYKDTLPHPRALTCVQFAKNAIELKNIWIQTPWQLYKKLNSI